MFPLQGIATQDMSAYKALYQRYFKPLALYAEGMTGNVLVAEDIVEDVIVKLWNVHPQFEDVRSFESYMFRSVHNAALNVIKHNDIISNYSNTMVTLSSEMPDEPFDENYEHLLSALMGYIETLPDKMRQVINLSLKGMTSPQIAKAMSISAETVKTHRKRALKILREKANG